MIPLPPPPGGSSSSEEEDGADDDDDKIAAAAANAKAHLSAGTSVAVPASGKPTANPSLLVTCDSWVYSDRLLACENRGVLGGAERVHGAV